MVIVTGKGGVGKTTVAVALGLRAAGEGKRKDDGTRIGLDVKEGDRVLFGKYSGSEIKLDGEEYLIMREDEILGVIERAGAASGKKGGK